jgi:hypothetical protein
MTFRDWLFGSRDNNSGTGGNNDAPSPPPPPDEKSSELLTLEDITRGMQHAATAANQFIARQYMQALDPFFEHTEDGVLEPRTIQMKLDDKHYFDLPLIALSTPRGLMLEKMKVFLTVRTDAVKKLPSGDELSIGQFAVSLSPSTRMNEDKKKQNYVDMEMQFTVLEPPESVMRLIDEYTNQIIPRINEQGA